MISVHMLSTQPSSPAHSILENTHDDQNDMVNASARALHARRDRCSTHGRPGRGAHPLVASSLQSEEEHYGKCLGPAPHRHCALMRNRALPSYPSCFCLVVRLHLPSSELRDDVRFFRFGRDQQPSVHLGCGFGAPEKQNSNGLHTPSRGARPSAKASPTFDK